MARPGTSHTPTGPTELSVPTPASSRQEFGLQRSSRSNISSAPESYIKAIISFAERSPADFLHAGVHYMQLANFFTLSTIPVTLHPRDNGQYAHVVVYEWAKGAMTSRQYVTADQIAGLASNALSNAPTGQLIFIRGHSNPDWLAPLGAQFRVDPEFLRRHLDFQLPNDHYDLPPLPSTFAQGFSLKFVTISRRTVAITGVQLHDLQQEEQNAVKKHQRQLGADGLLGESIIRRWTVHDEWIFTLEQHVSIRVKRKGDAWTAIVWLDCGRDLADGPSGPWLERESSPYSFQRASHYIPTIQHLSKAPLLVRNVKDSAENRHPNPGIVQNTKHLPLQYGSLTDPSLASCDAFYALSELLGLSAASECQFLNMMQDQIKQAVESTSVQLQDSLNSLRRMKALLDSHVQYLQSTVEVLRNLVMRESAEQLEGANAPISGESDRVAHKRRKPVENTVLDFEQLLGRAKHLSSQCFEGSQIILSTSMLEESRKSIEVSQYVARLSFLAFLFLPLTFTTGFFGMNFRELGQGSLSIWVFCTVLVPVAIFGGLLCFWTQVMEYFGRRFGHKRRK